MPFSQETINHLAHLARLEFVDKSQSAVIQENLTNIVAMMDEVSVVNTENIEPMSHPLDMIQRLREDTVTEKRDRDALLALAPCSEAGLFLVPKVLTAG